MVNKEFMNEVRFKNHTCYYFDDIIKSEDFNVDNILVDKKSQENTLINGTSSKTFSRAKPLLIRFDKIDVFLEVMIEIDIEHCVALKNMMT